MIYGAAVVFTVALARASRAKGLFYAALLIAASWSIGLIVYFFETATGAEYPFAYPAIDGVVAGLIMVLATRPNYSGRAPLVFISLLLLVQALYQLSVTAYGYYNPGLELNVSYLVMFGINRLFEIILISIWVVSALRIMRRRYPELHETLWRTAGVLPRPPDHDEALQFQTQDAFDKHIGAKLTEARRSLGWSTQRLATECELSEEEVAQYESGRKPVPPSTLQQISKLLGVRMNYFTDGLDTGL